MGATPRPAVRDYPAKILDWALGARHSAHGDLEHLEATMAWLARAQDAGDDDGLARMFHVKRGWGASYPETTGYAIPTFFAYADNFGKDEFAGRGLKMARWESEVQMANGAVQGGVITDAATPAIFNTGQVLFGWYAAFKRTGESIFSDSATRAADYLVDQMDDDGAWRKNLSEFTSTPIETYAYNVRSAWALLLARGLPADGRYEAAALRNLEFVLTLCHENGWIEMNCLGRPEQPLLHTIAYAYQGLVECASLVPLDAALDVAVAGNSELLANFRQFGRLHGRYDKNWCPTVRWRCLTGEAQTAIVWFRLGQITGNADWEVAGIDLVAQIKKTQSLAGEPGRAGGVKGAWPITSPYGPMQYLNWAAKFFADALMLKMGVEGASRAG